MLLRLAIISILFILATHGYGQQEYERTMTVTEWIEEMAQCSDEKYSLSNTIIVNDQIGMAARYQDSLYPETDISAHVTIRNCRFDGNGVIYFYKLNFHGSLRIISLEGPALSFRSCEFGRLIIWRATLDAFDVSSCTIYEELSARNSDFGTRFAIQRTALIDTTPGVDEGVFRSDDRSLFHFNSTVDNLKIHESTFSTTERPDSVDVFNNAVNLFGNFENIDFVSSDFNVPVKFSNGNVQNYFTVKKCTFKYLLFNKFNLPEYGTNFHWSMIGGDKLGIFNLDEYYRTDVDSQFLDIYRYPELVSVYNKFYSIYRTRGDLSSANQCYIEMKDLETRRQAIAYEVEPTMNGYFSWKLNEFLKYFCEYGTSPVRSLIISMYVVLGFSFFYFFFYSEWDKINRTFLIRKYRKLLGYFTSEQKLEDFYLEDHRDEFRNYEEFKTEMDEKRKETPGFYRVLGIPLYHLSLLSHNLLAWMYRRTEILEGRWIDLTARRKLFVGTVVVISITLYGIYLIMVRSLNSVFLSINTFSTLGFGDIPVTGISRYIAILEGFLGWFLLSIFSVSLISQILQNV